MANIYGFGPKISVYPAATLNAQNPFATPFILENQGRLPIYSIHIEARFIDVVDSAHVHMSSTGRFIEYSPRNPLPILGSGKKTVVQLPQMVAWHLPILSATAEAFVDFRPCFYRKISERGFTFVMVKSASGELVWLPLD